MYSRADINIILTKFISAIRSEYPVKEAYLFGSYAKGNSNDNSDIDLAIVSDNFEGNRFNDRDRLGKFIIYTSADLEIHPYRPEDFTEDNPFVKEIIKTGIKIV